jgi:uncharacterized protein (UPF0332 family)
VRDSLKEIEMLSAKAQTFLASAGQLLSTGDYDSCASRCYYAMFLMAQAALLTKNLSSPSHKGVISLFGENFAKTGVLESYMGRVLNFAYDKRIVGDYGVTVSVAQDEAEHLLDAAQDFVGKVKDYLDKWAEQK